jgi:hypothetical protein
MGRRGAPQPGSGEQPGSVELSIENKGNQKSSLTINLEGIIKSDNTLIFKLEKKGNLYTAYYSVDGKNYETVGSADVILKDIKTGMIVCEGVLPVRMAGSRRFMQQDNQKPGLPFEVAFDYFRIKNTALRP